MGAQEHLKRSPRANLNCAILMFFRALASTLGCCFLAGCHARESAQLSAPTQTLVTTNTAQKTTPQVPPLMWKKSATSLALRCRQNGVRPRDLRLVVEKQPRPWKFEDKTELSSHPTLLVFVGKRLLKAYPVALGYDPVGDKQKRGDYRTPEGRFFLCGRNEKSQFFRSIRLNYPNTEDAERGLAQGLISRATRDRIVKANRRGGVPPQDTALGGDIMIHGGGIGTNWTWGCVALDNPAVQELFDFLPIGTPVEILAPQRRN